MTTMTGDKGTRYGASAESIQYHYDIGNEFLSLAQEKGRNYSCALWEEGDSHEEAQIRKLDYHLDQIQADDSKRLLDIGCGWGSMLNRMVTHRNVGSAVGLTLAHEQKKYIEHAYPSDQIDVHIRNWQDYTSDTPYDGIISLGAFEHFAKMNEDKVTVYRSFFKKCYELTKPNGRLSLQTMAYGDVPRNQKHTDLFIANDVFPESDFPRLADICEACEMYFEVERLRNDRMDYAKTMRAWFRGLRDNREKALELHPLEIVERYERLYRTMSYSFELGAFALYRITFRRIEENRISR